MAVPGRADTYELSLRQVLFFLSHEARNLFARFNLSITQTDVLLHDDALNLICIWCLCYRDKTSITAFYQ